MGKSTTPQLRNPVATFMEDFNRPVTHKDRKKDLKRGSKPKHRKPLQENE